MADFPKPFAPMLLSELKRPFHKPGWVYEEKYDGYRAVAYKNGSSVRLISRNLKDLTAQFEEAVEAVARLRAPTLVLDGEVAVFNESLISHLGFLRSSKANEGMLLTPPVFVAFDCVYARGKDLFNEPLNRRRKVLEKELAGAPGPIFVARRLAADGLEAWEEVKSHGWEGLVAKDAASVYEPGVRTKSWIKVKHKVRVGWPEEGVEYTRG
ncbi:MAG TPA: RNA ligase family protein [Thermoanaerobaculia bacterium]|nr:RNA ligase family protein [Thermoanaerobaculia bacterium]